MPLNKTKQNKKNKTKENKRKKKPKQCRTRIWSVCMMGYISAVMQFLPEKFIHSTTFEKCFVLL